MLQKIVEFRIIIEMVFIEASATNSINVAKAFETLVGEIIDNFEYIKLPEHAKELVVKPGRSIRLKSSSGKEKTKSCCN